jgi:alpha-1,3-rhamnosyl/mannosyltransferase
LQDALRPLGLTVQGYSLFVGTVEPRKNLSALLDAYEGLPALQRSTYPLVIAGGRGWLSNDIHARMSKAASAGWLHYLSYVPQERLPALYSGARLFVYPSLYEGFGLPLLEAMASGVPVVCSNIPSLHEVAGDAARLVDPFDVAGLQAAISRGLEDEDWRDTAVQQGIQRAAGFTWQRCARQTVEVYQAVTGTKTTRPAARPL